MSKMEVPLSSARGSQVGQCLSGIPPDPVRFHYSDGWNWRSGVQGRKRGREKESNEIEQVKNGEWGCGLNGGSGGEKIEVLNKFIVLKRILGNKKGVLLKKMAKVKLPKVLKKVLK